MQPFELTLRPRYGEVDSMGVVYHAHYLVYFDLGRTEYMRAAGAGYAALEARGFRLAVVEAAVRYLKPAHFDELLHLGVRLTAVGGASVAFDYELRGPDGSALATGSTRLGCLDRVNRPARLPADTAKLLRASLATAATGSPGGRRRPGIPPRKDSSE